MVFDADPDDPIYGDDMGDDFLRLSNPSHVEVTWRAVQAELDRGWTVTGVQRGRRPGDWIATASGPGKGAGAGGYGHSPADALMDLLDVVKGRRSEAQKKKLPPPW